MKRIFVLLAFLLIPQISFADGTFFSDEQQKKIHESLEKASANVQAWIHGVKEDVKGIVDGRMIGTVFIDLKKDAYQNERERMYSRTYPGNLEIYDVKVDTDVPGIVYLTTAPDNLPHLIIYFQPTDPQTNYPKVFKDLLSNPENNGFQLLVTRVIDYDTQQESAQTIKVMAKDLKLKRPSDNTAMDLKDLLCPIVEPGITDKAWAFMSGKTAEPTHTDCL